MLRLFLSKSDRSKQETANTSQWSMPWLVIKLAWPKHSSKVNTPTLLRRIMLLPSEMESKDSLKTSFPFKLISSEESLSRKISMSLPLQPTTSQKSNTSSKTNLAEDNKTDKEDTEEITETTETTEIEITKIGQEEMIEEKAEDKIEDKETEETTKEKLIDLEEKVSNAKKEIEDLKEKEETTKAILTKDNLEKIDSLENKNSPDSQDKTDNQEDKTEDKKTETLIETTKLKPETIEEKRGLIETITTEEEIDLIETTIDKIETIEETETITETIALQDNTNKRESKTEREELLLHGPKSLISLQETKGSTLTLR